MSKLALVLGCLLILSLSCIGLIGCCANDGSTNDHLTLEELDKSIIKSAFDPELPGYSDIKILSREGDGTVDNPRILKFQVTIECYPSPVVCDGKLKFVWGDPCRLEKSWSTLEGAGLYLLVHWARNPIIDVSKYNTYYYYNQPQHVSLMLKHWIDSKFIKIEDILDSRMYKLVNEMIINPASVPAGLTNIGLFNLSNITTTDLVPDLSAEKKVPVYILRRNGVIDLYLTNNGFPNPAITLEHGDSQIPLVFP